eukprot:GHVR01041783.1.p1 GENE.GHVR01041783.1~~GHVR01041783.1.p1  ORF type:complete len:245 (+),score=9.51 GHVR01041783.1:548-1282(+)
MTFLIGNCRVFGDQVEYQSQKGYDRPVYVSTKRSAPDCRLDIRVNSIHSDSIVTWFPLAELTGKEVKDHIIQLICNNVNCVMDAFRHVPPKKVDEVVKNVGYPVSCLISFSVENLFLTNVKEMQPNCVYVRESVLSNRICPFTLLLLCTYWNVNVFNGTEQFLEVKNNYPGCGIESIKKFFDGVEDLNVDEDVHWESTLLSVILSAGGGEHCTKYLGAVVYKTQLYRGAFCSRRRGTSCRICEN